MKMMILSMTMKGPTEMFWLMLMLSRVPQVWRNRRHARKQASSCALVLQTVVCKPTARWVLTVSHSRRHGQSPNASHRHVHRHRHGYLQVPRQQLNLKKKTQRCFFF